MRRKEIDNTQENAFFFPFASVMFPCELKDYLGVSEVPKTLYFSILSFRYLVSVDSLQLLVWFLQLSPHRTLIGWEKLQTNLNSAPSRSKNRKPIFSIRLLVKHVVYSSCILIFFLSSLWKSIRIHFRRRQLLMASNIHLGVLCSFGIPFQAYLITLDPMTLYPAPLSAMFLIHFYSRLIHFCILSISFSTH